MRKRITATVLLAIILAFFPIKIAYAENCLSVRDYGRHMYKEWYYKSGSPRVLTFREIGGGKCIVTFEQDKYGVCICGDSAKVGVYTWTEIGLIDYN